MGKKTIAIHGKNTEDFSYKKGVSEPLQLSSTFYFNSIEEVLKRPSTANLLCLHKREKPCLRRF